MTFADYAGKYEREYVATYMKPASQVVIKSHLRTLRKTFQGKPIGLTFGDVQPAIAGLIGQGFAPKTVRNLWSTARAMMSHAKREGLVETIPEPAFPKDTIADRDWFTMAEMQALIASEDRDALLWATLAETGLRIGEVLALRPQDIVLDRRAMIVDHSLFAGVHQAPKTLSSYRTLSLSIQLAKRLRAQVLGMTAPVTSRGIYGFLPKTLFTNSQGRAVWPTSALKRLQEKLRSLGFPVTGFHAFRRSSISQLGDLGMPAGILAYRVGHAPPGMTGKYYRTSPDALKDRKWVELYGDLLFGEEGFK